MSGALRALSDADAVDPAIFAEPVRYVGRGGAVTELVPAGLAEHRAAYGLRPSCTGSAADDLIVALDDARLTGRGGAHLPAAVKWRAVRAAVRDGGGPAVVVANGAESEPDSRKDAALLELRPHLVLDGLVCAAEALGAAEAIVWLHEGADDVCAAVRHALTERRVAHRDEPAVRIETGPAGYLGGESGAVVRALSGGPAVPTFRTRPSARHGVHGRPTLVANVETLARVALIARGEAPASVLVTVAVAGTRIVLEAPDGVTVGAAVAGVLGPVAPAAVLLGGYGGMWARWPDVAGVALTEPALRAHGLGTGAGVLAPLLPDECGLARAARLADHLAGQSAGQCGPCRFGLRSVADATASLARGGSRSRRDVRSLPRHLAEIAGRGACGHPDGAVRMVASALEVFADDVAAHGRGRCTAATDAP